MVLSNLKNAERYYSINPLFKAGIEFLLKNINAKVGRYPIVGDDCFVMIVDGTKRSKSEAKLEVHDQYIDVQVVLSGSESFGYKSRAACMAPKGEFDTKNDIGFFEDASSSYLDAEQNDMVIFFPEDAHAPLVGSGVVHKAILKIRA
ncbi:MAG: YhcH/YjgK/YiaL family protein [Mucinivorans sp.]